MNNNKKEEACKLCRLVSLTLREQEKYIHEWMGTEVKYYIAGSFATFLHNGKYLYNDIDVFVIDHNSDIIDQTQRYEISKSYKIALPKCADNSVGHKCSDYCLGPKTKNVKSRICRIGAEKDFIPYDNTNIPNNKRQVQLNIVFVKQCSGIDHLLNFFDINCCQVGFELNISNGCVGEAVSTDDYKSFLSSEILQVVTFDTPGASLFRLLKKSHQLGLPNLISPVHLLHLKHLHNSCKCVNRGLFEEVSTIMEMNGSKNKLMRNFEFKIMFPSEEEINEHFYDHGEYEELSASMSFLIKNGRGVQVLFTGNFRNELHYTCIHGEHDNFSCFKRLLEKKGVMNVFLERDEMNLSPVDYLLSHSSQSAIETNTFVITQLLKEKK